MMHSQQNVKLGYCFFLSYINYKFYAKIKDKGKAYLFIPYSSGCIAVLYQYLL